MRTQGPQSRDPCKVFATSKHALSVCLAHRQEHSGVGRHGGGKEIKKQKKKKKKKKNGEGRERKRKKKKKKKKERKNSGIEDKHRKQVGKTQKHNRTNPQ